jgi:transposase
VTWKNQGFKLDTTYNRVRLSKGTNMKESRYAADYILCEYTSQADEHTLDDVENLQTVRAVWTGDQWELHFVCEMQIDQPVSLSEKTAGIDLGICNTAAVSVGDELRLSLSATRHCCIRALP